MIANFDQNLGRLFTQLDELGLDENTIVIFTSDHGTAAGFDPATGDGFNAGLRGKKGSVYEGGHRVGFFLRRRNHLPANHRINELTAHIDILPTLIDLCALDSAPDLDLDGLSLVPLINDPEKQLPDRSIVIQLQPDNPQKWHHTVVMNGPWRLVNNEELYDVRTDPAQENDIAAANVRQMAVIRQDYHHFWQAIAPHFTQYSVIPVGTEHENPVLLSARDWHPTHGRVPWKQAWADDPAYNANGFWMIDIVTAGNYTIELRAGPHEANMPLRANRAVLQSLASTMKRLYPQPTAQPCSTLTWTPLQTSLSAELIADDASRSRGAYFVYIYKQ